MQGRLWLAKKSNSSACRVPSLQNVPVRPANAQSAHSFFWDYRRILKKISITHCSGLLYHMRRLRKEEYLKKTENLDSARTWRLESQWCVEDTHSAAVWCCSRPMVGPFYKAVPVLADEDKIGGSAIFQSTVTARSQHAASCCGTCSDPIILWRRAIFPWSWGSVDPIIHTYAKKIIFLPLPCTFWCS